MGREAQSNPEPATERTPRTWQVDRSSPVRADADSMFVPASDLPPEAGLGDMVVLSSDAGDEQRTGTIVDTGERDGERFFRVELRA